MFPVGPDVLDGIFIGLDFELYQLNILREFEERQSEIEDVVYELSDLLGYVPSSWI